MRNGQGRMIYPVGDIYEGDWVDDQKNGKGTYFYADGTKYI